MSARPLAMPIELAQCCMLRVLNGPDQVFSCLCTCAAAPSAAPVGGASSAPAPTLASALRAAASELAARVG